MTVFPMLLRNGRVETPVDPRSLMKTFRIQARVASFVATMVLLLQIAQAQAQTYSYAFEIQVFAPDGGS
jgi:hypothetical protein